ncbi:MAG: tetratricopeptide repeat protein [Alphaproteobacteria bacterium]
MTGKAGKNAGNVVSKARSHAEAGRIKEAFALCRQALETDPEQADILNFLGHLSLRLDNADTAVNLFAKAVVADACEAAYEYDLADALLGTGKLATSALSVRNVCAMDMPPAGAAGLLKKLQDAAIQAIEKNDKNHEALFALGVVLKINGDLDAALQWHRRALRLQPDYAETDTGDSVALLVAGDLERGWMAFEWRHVIGSLGPFTEIIWNGEDLEGKTVLVWGEQGLGDQILFANCLGDIIGAAGRVLMEIDERLVPLFQRSFPEAIVHGTKRFKETSGSWRDHDWLEDHRPLDFMIPQGSLPRFYRPRLDSFPDHQGFLVADPQRVDFWAERLAAPGPGLRVGIAWRSVFMTEKRQSKYPPIDCFAPLFALPGVRFISVQANMTPQEKADIEARFGIVLEVMDGIDLADDMDETAALLSALDAVVSADTYLPMMAAALGRATWRITRSPKTDDWSFLGAETDYPWFPSMTVRFGESEEELLKVFEKIAEEVETL